jgi:hypothetical protein
MQGMMLMELIPSLPFPLSVRCDHEELSFKLMAIRPALHSPPTDKRETERRLGFHERFLEFCLFHPRRIDKEKELMMPGIWKKTSRKHFIFYHH